MFKVHVNSGAVIEHNLNKDVAKPAARKLLVDQHRSEEDKGKDEWWRKRFDSNEARKNAKNLERNLTRVLPEKLDPASENAMLRRAKQLKDQFVVGMPTWDELHPVKQFEENGKTVVVVDEERMRLTQIVKRQQEWEAKNGHLVREYKQIMRHLDPDNPNAGDIERFRGRGRSG